MANIGYTEPELYGVGLGQEPDMRWYPGNTGAGIKRSHFVAISGGLLNIPSGVIGTGMATSAFVGMALADQTASYFLATGGATSIATPSAANSGIVGYSTASTALQPGTTFSGIPVALAHFGQQYVVSLQSGYVWSTTGVGLTVGIYLETVSGVCIADNTATNKCATIVDSFDGPGNGAVGDTGKRVIIEFNSAELAF